VSEEPYDRSGFHKRQKNKLALRQWILLNSSGYDSVLDIEA